MPWKRARRQLEFLWLPEFELGTLDYNSARWNGLVLHWDSHPWSSKIATSQWYRSPPWSNAKLPVWSHPAARGSLEMYIKQKSNGQNLCHMSHMSRTSRMVCHWWFGTGRCLLALWSSTCWIILSRPRIEYHESGRCCELRPGYPGYLDKCKGDQRWSKDSKDSKVQVHRSPFRWDLDSSRGDWNRADGYDWMLGSFYFNWCIPLIDHRPMIFFVQIFCYIIGVLESIYIYISMYVCM